MSDSYEKLGRILLFAAFAVIITLLAMPRAEAVILLASTNSIKSSQTIDLVEFKQVMNSLKDSISDDAVVTYADSLFSIVNYEDLEKFNKDFVTMHRANATYSSNRYDCDDYAALYASMLRLISQTGTNAHAAMPAVAKAGVDINSVDPSQSNHMLNVVLTDRGIMVVEPQTGDMAPLTDYSYHKQIILLDFM